MSFVTALSVEGLMNDMYMKSEKNAPKNKPRKGGCKDNGISCPWCKIKATENITEELRMEKEGFIGFYICPWCGKVSKIYKDKIFFETFLCSNSLRTKVILDLE